ncbi:hypothetical protein [Pelodictyon luteolum]|uniref:Uncharacterized protein n=1 Tax=Chlorobium luteolum (strain DSM 273 / BCRC 81028 / 2530) TaxID=319225 RepID=Q3B5Z8_CHLL3|nr:hypothetical protein [Pelodictyon luteolum]ABB23233.1 hypothetical protein Plut_0345 [Pelodictyon luteolum DSM 273]
MKKIIRFALAALALAAFLPSGSLQAKQWFGENPLKQVLGIGFTDADLDGYNDNAPDADGDGIPNGQDPDYVAVPAGTPTADCDGTGRLR